MRSARSDLAKPKSPLSGRPLWVTFIWDNYCVVVVVLVVVFPPPTRLRRPESVVVVVSVTVDFLPAAKYHTTTATMITKMIMRTVFAVELFFSI